VLLGEFKNAYDILDGETEWKRLLGRPRLGPIREDNIKMNFLKIACQDFDWFQLFQDSVHW
jgi:hypothetical protein